MAKHAANAIYNLPDQKGKRLTGVKYEGILAGLLVIVLVSWIATQYAAYSFGYQDALGKPMATLIKPIYQPFAWIVWGWKFGDLENAFVRSVFSRVYIGMTGGVSVAIFLAAWLSYRRSRKASSGAEHIHGSAHWASPEEAKATGLLNGAGVYVGAYQRPGSTKVEYLRHDGPEHIMAFAPTRSGKGVGLVLPTLLSWPHSALVYDIKGENFALTSGWRQKKAGNHVLKFEPTATDGSSVRFNPLAEIRLGTDHEVSDVQNIVTMIVDPDGKGLNDHWAKTGHALLVGAVLHVLYAEEDKTLAGVANFLSDPSRTLIDTLNYMLGTAHDRDSTRGWPEDVHPVVAASARDMLNKSENEMSGVLSTAMSFLTLYRDPVVSKNTAFSEFKVRDLMNADKPVTLYLVVPPSDKDRLKPLIRLVVNQVVRTLTERMEFKDGRSVAGYKHRLLLLIDEFPSLGKLDIFEEALAFIAGYGMKAYLIIQDISQLWTAYGKDESIFSNCHIRVAYAPNKIETADLLSKMTGTATITKQQTNYSGDLFQPMLKNISSSSQEVARPLLTPDEVMRLPAAKKDSKGNVTEAGDMLIFVAGHAPIYGKQILYFMDPIFSERAKVAAPAQSDRLATDQGAVAALPAPAEPQQAAAPEAPEPVAGDAEIVIEEAPDDIADPMPEPEEVDVPDVPAPAVDAAEEAEAVPLEALQHGGEEEAAPAEEPTPVPEPDAPPPEEESQAEQEPAPAEGGDALLAEMQAISGDAGAAGDDFLGMFDDVLDEGEKAATPAASASTDAEDLADGMLDLLNDAANPQEK